MPTDRRTVLSALALLLPFAPRSWAAGPAAYHGPPPALRFRPFEEAVRAAFADAGQDAPVRRIEVGPSEALQAGVQGCHNDRPFAGFPAGHLRIVCTGSGPGPVFNGVRLYVSTVDVARTGGPVAEPSRPLDFGLIPPAPVLAAADGSPFAPRSRRAQ